MEATHEDLLEHSQAEGPAGATSEVDFESVSPFVFGAQNSPNTKKKLDFLTKTGVHIWVLYVHASKIYIYIYNYMYTDYRYDIIIPKPESKSFWSQFHCLSTGVTTG